VEQRDDIGKYVYSEEEEEVDGDGNVKTTSKKVEIQPRWLATSAELVTDANKGSILQNSILALKFEILFHLSILDKFKTKKHQKP
jgi:hypothetical protein